MAGANFDLKIISNNGFRRHRETSKYFPCLRKVMQIFHVFKKQFTLKHLKQLLMICTKVKFIMVIRIPLTAEEYVLF